MLLEENFHTVTHLNALNRGYKPSVDKGVQNLYIDAYLEKYPNYLIQRLMFSLF